MERSQSVPSRQTTHIGALMPNVTIWVGQRGRLLTGVEAMALQGIHVPGAGALPFTDAQWYDLAGNAFCLASCLPVQMIGVLVFACLRARLEERVRRANDFPHQLLEEGREQPSCKRQRSDSEDALDWSMPLARSRRR